MRGRTTAALGTSLDGSPYVSLVLVAFDIDGAPLLLLSDLAQHTRNITADARVSLLFDGAGEYADPLTGPRLTVLGVAALSDDPATRRRYVGAHPSAAMYAGFKDFNLYRVSLARGHFVAGFGKIAWIEADRLLGRG